MRLALHVPYRPFSVTSEESLRHSEPPLMHMDTQAGDFMFMRSQCACVIQNLYTLSGL